MNLPTLSPGAQKAHDKSTAKAQRKNIDVADALLVLEGVDAGSPIFLVVRRDRVEAHNLGKGGTLTRKGKGVEEIGIQRISSVEARKAGMIRHEIKVYTSGNTITVPFPVREWAEAARAVISALMNGAGEQQPAVPAAARDATAPSASAAPPPPPGVPAGWYPDGALQRYWDGSTWTEHTAPLPQS